MKITVKNTNNISEYKKQIKRYAKVNPENVRIQAAFQVDDVFVIRYSYNGMIFALMNDPNSTPKHSVYYVLDESNYTGEWLEN